jgi:hypothetical protein
MAQDPEGREDGLEPGSIDPSHELDTVVLYSSCNGDADFEADLIRGILESQGIPSLKLRATGYPSLGLEVRVPRSDLREAERLIEEAKAAGPAAAWEAVEESEKGR